MIEKKDYPQVLLLGNGLCQANGGVSWNGFLKAIATKKEIICGEVEIEKLSCPEPLKAILVTEDHVDIAMERYCKEITFQEQTPSAREAFRELLSLGFDEILTTNYTYDLELAVLDSQYGKVSNIKKMMHHTTEVKQAEAKYLLHTYNEIVVDDCINRVWHIHGEARKPNSTVLGHYYYGNLLYKIKELLNQRNYSKNTEIKSWVDAFILGDVYVLGFGFGFSEIDLWWLINRKAREKANTGKVYFYEAAPVGFNEKRELLRLMRKQETGENVVEFVDCGFREKCIIEDGAERHRLNGNYPDFYRAAVRDIKEKLAKKKTVKEQAVCVVP